jgi:hypothetical protein
MAAQSEPRDYRFLSWLWENIDDFCRCDPSVITAEYTRRTKEPSPYEAEATSELRELCVGYFASIEAGEGPSRLIEVVCYELDDDELPLSEEVLNDLRGCLEAYYGSGYASGILSVVKEQRMAARKLGMHWDWKLRMSVYWRHGLAVETPEHEGTTNISQVEELAKE